MDEQIFKEIQTLKRRILPDERVILFGSQARGDARPDSDWDLLVLLNKKKRNFIEDYDKYGDPFDELGWKHHICINALIYASEDWDLRPSLLKCNVEREGIEVV